MTELYIPDTSTVREGFSWSCHDSYLKVNRDHRAEDFDHWLSDHDRQVQEKAWDHCLDEIEANEINTAQAREGNPYRKES